MTPCEKRLCPITRRFAEDMKIRNRAPSAIDAYTYHARRFADFIRKPPDRATVEDVRNFRLHLIATRMLAYSSFNLAVGGPGIGDSHTPPGLWHSTPAASAPVVSGRLLLADRPS